MKKKEKHFTRPLKIIRHTKKKKKANYKQKKLKKKKKTQP